VRAIQSTAFRKLRSFSALWPGSPGFPESSVSRCLYHSSVSS
jgi:hypothetical protein